MVGQLQLVDSPPTHPRSRKKIPAVWMRAGTSKGLFLHRKHLPTSQTEWAPILLAIMGSQLGDPRQLDGIGGATSTTSKVALVEKSKRPGIDVEYTFVQVSTTEATVDVSGNCGNMASAVGPFALDEGLVNVPLGKSEVDIRILNVNTNRVLVETVAVSTDGSFQENGEYSIAGVKGTGSPIRINFLSPAGSMTGKLFPTGKRMESITVDFPLLTFWEKFTVQVTLIDCANPFVLIDDSSLPPWYHRSGPEESKSLEFIEQIRREASVRFGLADDLDQAASIRGTPKIAIISRPSPFSLDYAGDGTTGPAHLQVTAFSMGKVHPSLQLTGAVCIGMSLTVPGTVTSDPLPHKLRNVSSPGAGGCISYQSVPTSDKEGDRKRRWRIRHRSGEIEAEVTLAEWSDGKQEDGDIVESVAVFRTARRLFEGSVLFH